MATSVDMFKSQKLRMALATARAIWAKLFDHFQPKTRALRLAATGFADIVNVELAASPMSNTKLSNR
jgi:hypothetical protein